MQNAIFNMQWENSKDCTKAEVWKIQKKRFKAWYNFKYSNRKVIINILKIWKKWDGKYRNQRRLQRISLKKSNKVVGKAIKKIIFNWKTYLYSTINGNKYGIEDVHSFPKVLSLKQLYNETT